MFVLCGNTPGLQDASSPFAPLLWNRKIGSIIIIVS